jgi:hypothetical protein
VQNWEKQRITSEKQGNGRENSVELKDQLISEKRLIIDVSLRREKLLSLNHLILLTQVLCLIYPEIKKAKKFLKVLISICGLDFIPDIIKVPVMSSLGIKAIIKINDIRTEPLSTLEIDSIFFDVFRRYQNLGSELPEPG